jgi:hypothetical protein
MQRSAMDCDRRKSLHCTCFPGFFAKTDRGATRPYKADVTGSSPSSPTQSKPQKPRVFPRNSRVFRVSWPREAQRYIPRLVPSDDLHLGWQWLGRSFSVDSSPHSSFRFTSSSPSGSPTDGSRFAGEVFGVVPKKANGTGLLPVSRRVSPSAAW